MCYSGPDRFWKRGLDMNCETFALDQREYKYVVVFSCYQGRLLFSRHRQRDTWETQGGHIEPGETLEQAARRELWEESGAEEFTLTPVCGYRAWEGDSGACGAVFVAQIAKLGPMPQSEMGGTGLFDHLPENLTYPGITPVLWQRVKKFFPSLDRENSL